MTHTVQRGETLFRIARQYNLTVGELRTLNDLTSNDSLKVGQVLTVRKEPEVMEELQHEVYTVTRGDSLFTIANRFLVSVEKLRKLNNLEADTAIFPGQQLIVRSKPAPAGEAAVRRSSQEEYVVQRGDSLLRIANQFGIRLNELLEMNGLGMEASIYPGQTLRVKPLPAPEAVQNAAKTYIVKPGDSLYGIAVKHGVTAKQLMEWNTLAQGSYLTPGQTLAVADPADVRAPEDMPTEKHEPETPEYYVVQRGDSLFGIAQKHGLSIQQLRELNQLAPQATIFPGQRLLIREGAAPSPASESEAPTFYTVQRGDSLFAISNKFSISRQELLTLNGLSAQATIYPGQKLRIRPEGASTPETEPEAPENNQKRKTKRYIVKKGDWLSKIARMHNVSVEEIMEYNDLENTRINVGDRLDIPKPNQIPIPKHLKKTARKIRKARRDFDLSYVNGEEVFEYGLKGAVGNVERMYPADVDNVQNRLMQLSFLPEAHGEDPFELQEKLGTRPLWSGSIPKTIAAIEALQNYFKVDFWMEEPKRHDLLDGVSYHRGVVSPGDLTYKLLEEYTEYTLTVPHPYEKREKIASKFNNFHVSRHTVDYRGVSFKGTANPEIPLELFTNLGLDETLAKAVQYVSAHEGNFDAINTFDKAIFSYGFIQFAGAGGGLGAVMALMKARQPKLFEEYFCECGIDVDPIYSGNKIVAGELKVFDLYNTDGNFEKTGEAAEKAIALDKELYGPFIRAGHRLEFIACQIEAAVEGYVKPALKIKTDINAGNMALQQIPLTEIICSPMGLGLMIDLTVNQWVNRTREVFRAAIEKVALANRLDTPELLKSIDEVQVIEAIVQDAGALDDRIAKRGSNFLASSLSAQKGDTDLSKFIA